MASGSVPLTHFQPASVKIFGAGAWGSALAELIRETQHSVSLWNRTSKPGTSTYLTESISPQSHIIIAISVQHVGSFCHILKSENITPSVIWIASKGLDSESGNPLCTRVQEWFPSSMVGVISGPNIASEITHHLPCGMTIACENRNVLLQGKSLFPQRMLIETSTDVTGVSWWGALKNVMAIGYGLLQQSDMGYNMSATFLTLCAKEISAIAQEKGGCPETMLSFAGMGDLILTSHCPQGRNRAYGQDFPKEPTRLVEGLDTLRTLMHHSQGEKAWRTPIITAIWDVLETRLSVKDFPARILSAH
jgi:glycerol-3-phosphate dehydrogenase (NAD(P)+)